MALHKIIQMFQVIMHKEIANKYFLPFVVGLFFRSALYSPIFYIPSASLPCEGQKMRGGVRV